MELCLGTAQIGIPYGINNERSFSIQNSFGILQIAIENNIRYFDTARAYGQAESILGRFINGSNCDRRSFKIISKINGNERLFVQIESSLKNLQTKAIEGCLLHDESLIYNAKVVNELSMLKQQGFVNNIGVSAYNTNVALHAANLDWVDYIQIPYNAFDQRLEHTDFFRISKENKKTIFARSALLQGLLVMSPEKAKVKLPIAYEKVLLFRKLVDKYEVTPLEAAIQFVKSNSHIDFLVFGADDNEQLQAFIKIFKESKVSNEMIEEIKEAFKSVDERIIMPTLWPRVGD